MKYKNRFKGLPKWDGVKRLHLVGSAILGAKPTVAHHKAIHTFFLDAARRVIDPGCPVSSILLLCGPAGIGKSMFFRTLAGPDGYIDGCGIEDNVYPLMHAHWLVELSDLQSIDIDKFKSLAFRSADLLRPLYGRNAKPRRRAFVLVGTTNSVARDFRFSRRVSVVVITKKIDLELLARKRNQLWAEALAAVMK